MLTSIQQHLSSSSRYRSDIDGIRALAVLMVIAFHAGIAGLPGGFVGVDVFFVISGYLIAGQIRSDCAAGTFRFLDFWDRRIRRIWPAAILVTGVTLLAGAWIMLPTDFRVLGMDAIAQITMLANVRYWLATDYFSTSSELRPLLHTWSLAVEEQFYVLFPALLVVLYSATRPFRTATLLLVAAGLSLLAAEWAARSVPSAAFFLLPFRVYELTIGAALAVVPRGSRSMSARLAWAFGLTGISLIAFAGCFYSPQTRFPGISALVPCAGAAFLLAAGEQKVVGVSRLLSLAPVRVIGLMSFSLYLWHWPIFAFIRYCEGKDLSMAMVAWGLAATVVASALTWAHVEIPWRAHGRDRRERLSLASMMLVLMSALLLLASWNIYREDGFPGRSDHEVLAFGQPRPASQRFLYPEDRFRTGQPFSPIPLGVAVEDESARPCVLLWGDSHAVSISETLHEAANAAGINAVAAMLYSTAPLPGTWFPRAKHGAQGEAECDRWTSSVTDWIRTHEPAFVVLCANWSNYLGSPDSPGGLLDTGGHASSRRAELAFSRGIQTVLDACAPDTELWIVLEPPLQPVTPPMRAASAWLRGRPIELNGVTYDDHVRNQASVAAGLQGVEDRRIRVVDLAANAADGSGGTLVGSRSNAWYVDEHHLSYEGARALAGEWIDALMRDAAEVCLAERGVPVR